MSLFLLVLAALACWLMAYALSASAPGNRYRVGLVAVAALFLPLLLAFVVVLAVLAGHDESTRLTPEERARLRSPHFSGL